MSDNVCANCLDPFTISHTETCALKTDEYGEVDLGTEDHSSLDKLDIPSVLDTVFFHGARSKYHQLQGSQRGNEDFQMCHRCTTALADLLKSYQQFTHLCKLTSLVFKEYIGIVRQYYVKAEASGSDSDEKVHSDHSSGLKSKEIFTHDENERSTKLNSSEYEEDTERNQNESEVRQQSMSIIPDEDVKVEVDYYDNESDCEEAQMNSFIHQKLELVCEDEDKDQGGNFMKSYMILPDEAEEDETLMENHPRKRARGRPRKVTVQRQDITEVTEESFKQDSQRKRGRPRKSEIKRSSQVASRDEVVDKRDETSFKTDVSNEKVSDAESDFECSSTTVNSSESECSEKAKSRKPLPKKRGRHKKVIIENNAENDTSASTKRKRGRPSKSSSSTTPTTKVNAPDEVFKCPDCGKESTNKSNLTLHIRCVHEKAKKFQCSACLKRFFHKAALNIHHRRFHEGGTVKAFLCTIPGCGKSFAYPAGLNTHLFDHKPKTELPWTCEVCGKKFKRRCDLAGHMSKHNDDKPFICEQCGSFFKTNTNLAKHITSQHRQDNAKPLPTCHLCGKVLRNVYNLRIHIKTVHEGQKPYQCDVCGVSFTSASNLKVHSRGVHNS